MPSDMAGSIKTFIKSPIQEKVKIAADDPYELVGLRLNERDLEGFLNSYITMIDQIQKVTFAPIQQMIEQLKDGLDVQVLALCSVQEIHNSGGQLLSQNGPKPDEIAKIHGLVLVNQDHELNRNKNTGKPETKYVIHHISTTLIDNRGVMLSKVMEHIWKNTHCASIRITLHHFKNKAGIFEVDDDFKKLLKDRKFKWKRICNEESTRFEVYEVNNTDYVDQMRQSKAMIYRRGL